MGLDAQDFLLYVVRPTLVYLSPEIPYSVAAEQLLLGTALAESGLQWLKQQGGGPAVGLYQMEPFTEKDLWTTYLDMLPQKNLAAKVAGVMAVDGIGDATQWHLVYATCMARVKYRRAADPLPAEGDWQAQAEYWLRIYNAGGKGSVDHYLAASSGIRGFWA